MMCLTNQYLGLAVALEINMSWIQILTLLLASSVPCVNLRFFVGTISRKPVILNPSILLEKRLGSRLETFQAILFQ